MKKTLVSALTTALVVGAASTTFAAANPFADVPSDHWAYDAVSQLAADGVIEGYGDNNFKGDKNITRYEMAQMIAKAMAKANVGSNDKALIDKLAAEFADELNNLGVRVANLEKNADKVKWNGEARYTYKSNHHHKDASEADDSDYKKNSDKVLLRLEPTAEVNDHWVVKARLDAQTNLKNDAGDDGNVKLKRVWAQGNYGDWTIKAGKIPTTVDNDLIFDGEFSGAQVDYGKQFKVSVGAGRFNLNNANSSLKEAVSDIAETDEVTGEAGEDVSVADYQFIGLSYAPSAKWNLGAAFHHFKSKAFAITSLDENNVDDANIYSLRAAYKFDNNWKLDAVWADNTEATDYKVFNTAGEVTESNGDNSYAYRSQLSYKGAQKANKGSWGAWVAYAHLGWSAAIKPTYDAMEPGQKGWEVGANYALFSNVVATVRYADTKETSSDGNYYKDKNIFGRVQFFF